MLTLYVKFLIINLYKHNIFGIVNFINFILNDIFILFFGKVFSFVKINLIKNIICFKSCVS